MSSTAVTHDEIAAVEADIRWVANLDYDGPDHHREAARVYGDLRELYNRFTDQGDEEDIKTHLWDAAALLLRDVFLIDPPDPANMLE